MKIIPLISNKFVKNNTLKELFRVMRITLILLFVLSFQLVAENIKGQDAIVKLETNEVSVKQLINEIENQTDYLVVFSNREVDTSREVNLKNKSDKVSEYLNEAFDGTDIGYDFENNYIILAKKDSENKALEILSAKEVQQTGKTVTGKIIDSNGEPVVGATIVVQGDATKGTVTDVDGNYILTNLHEDAVLEITYVGMQSQSVSISGRTLVNVTLLEDIELLEEVVVVGYGTMKKVNLTGAVDAVNADQINSRPVGQATMALQGLIPGLTITQNSGKPGADGGTIRIRGIGTIGDSNPLILVDGIPGSINDLDVNEIENISVLKDAASASIYGSRAANGVILVTTKRAKDREFQVNYKASAGWQQPTSLMEKVSGYDHMVMINEAYKNMGRTPPFAQDYVDAYKLNAPSDEYPETNWHKEMLKDKAFQQNHYIGVNGGGEKINALGSVSYWHQDGIMHSKFQRLNLRLNTDIQIRKNIKFGFDVFLKNDGNTEPPQQWYWLARYPHNLAGKNENGTWGVGWDGQNGWASLEDGGNTQSRNNEVTANMKFDWQVLEGLNIGLQVAPNKVINHYKRFNKHVNLYYPDGSIINPSEFKANLTEKFSKYVTNNYKILIDYNKTINAHSLNLLGGWEAIDYKSEWIQGYREQYPLENYEVLNVGSQINQQATGSAAEWSLMSYFGRLNYDYKEKYLLEANIRLDGSSRFAKNYKYGVFPSFSAGWRISEEPFMTDLDWLSYLKLRGSWGMLGNQNIGNYPFVSSVTMGQNYVFGDLPVVGAALLDGSNPKISWESTKMINFGFDANLWKFDVSADYYVKNTYDILLYLPIPQIAGLNAPYQNSGKVRNTGWEMRIEYSDRINDFGYRIGANLADVKNKIVNLVGTGPYIYARTVHMEGYPIGSLFGLESEGLFQNIEEVNSHATQFGPVKPGDIKYKDQSIDIDGDGILDPPDGVVNAADRVIIGNPIPRYTYSFDFSCNFKEFDLGLFFQGVGKRDGYLDNFATMAFYLGGSAQEWHKDYWREDNPNASYPRLTFNFPNNEQVTSYWVRSAAYLRLKNLQLGYTMPKKIVNKISIQKLRMFFSGQNLLTFHDFYPSYDPEAPVGQGDFYPMVKVFSFGIEITL